jgi:hypothetical protein
MVTRAQLQTQAAIQSLPQAFSKVELRLATIEGNLERVAVALEQVAGIMAHVSRDTTNE